GWHWSGWSDDGREAPRIDLPEPALAAPCQLDNAAAAIAALHALRNRLGWDVDAIARGVAGARVAARLQRIAGTPEVIIDVAHNPQAARSLAAWLAISRAPGRTRAVFGALDDKDAAGIARILAPYVEAWYLAGLDRDSPRGLAAPELAARIAGPLEGAPL